MADPKVTIHTIVQNTPPPVPHEVRCPECYGEASRGGQLCRTCKGWGRIVVPIGP